MAAAAPASGGGGIGRQRKRLSVVSGNSLVDGLAAASMEDAGVSPSPATLAMFCQTTQCRMLVIEAHHTILVNCGVFCRCILSLGHTFLSMCVVVITTNRHCMHGVYVLGC